MAEIKRTQKDFYERLIELAERSEFSDKEDLVAFCKGRIEQIAKKSSGGRKANPLTEKVENFMREYMEANPNEILTCSQIANKATKALELEEPATPQRVSSIMKKLIAEGFAKNVKGSQYKKA